MINLPEKYKERMIRLLGEEFGDYEKALSETPVRAFRVNTDKISVEDFEKTCSFPRKKIPYSDTGFYFTYDKIGNHPFHHAGMIYVQEPGAMAPAECVKIEPDWTVLDMCAAPGGKSTQLKNKLGEKGVLVSNEIIPSRCKILTGNIERLGLKNVITTCADTEKLTRLFHKDFDLIMVDAPCSGEGMFRKEEIAVSEWSEENVRICAERQKGILDNAVYLLKDGGYIVYATCTFSLEENEMVIDSFLRKYPEFELVEVTSAVKESTCDGIAFDGCETESISFCRRFYPHKNKGEGQFMAVLKSTVEPSQRKADTKKSKTKENAVVTDFMNSVLTEYDKNHVIVNGDRVNYFTPDFPVPEAYFSCGVTVGEIKKNYILPHHQFFMAMGDKFRRKIELEADSPELIKYLHGEEIAADTDNGWAVVTVNGCSIGGAKVVSGKAKNHYPKGLRLKG
ncbi:MAG: NOL1/NOP2/sun family putative RNA methylase [Clostridia bacterium]|nr:NOL1/NOP2/sun family putative RNA methylase [Clostridia bacterium]